MDTFVHSSFGTVIMALFQGLFSVPSWHTFTALACGWALATDRHTITTEVGLAGATAIKHCSRFSVVLGGPFSHKCWLSSKTWLFRAFDESSPGWSLRAESHEGGYQCLSTPDVLILPAGGFARSHPSRIELSYTWNPDEPRGLGRCVLRPADGSIVAIATDPGMCPGGAGRGHWSCTPAAFFARRRAVSAASSRSRARRC